jgi:hypothetical protein
MLTLTDTVQYINQALNYPAVTITDIKLFLNQGISELNTSLHIDIPDIDTMIAEHRESYAAREDVIVLKNKPTDTTIIKLAKDDTTSDIVYDNTKGKFITRGTYTPGEFTNLYGVYMDYASGRHLVYKATMVNLTSGLWLEVRDDILNFDFTSYLAKDWIMLFLIPYVCYKYSVRDGDTGVLFSEEFSQGFQQLQNSFSVPSTVLLNDVVGQPAYSLIIKENLDNPNFSNIKITTRAILEKYRIQRHLNAVYDDFYNHGGWGL